MFKLVGCICIFITLSESFPWQFLEPVPGYIPVYIRNGDTPLEEINPELAEAFGVIISGRNAPLKNEITAEKDDANFINAPEEINEVPDLRKSSKSSDIIKPIEFGKKNKIYSFGTDTQADTVITNIQKISTSKTVP